MEKEKPAPPTSRLLAIKQTLDTRMGLPSRTPDGAPPVQPALEEKQPCCINCGYTQTTQPVDRCPECGLGFASRLRDPTPWTEGRSLPNWWKTAVAVWTWNRRIQARTALFPITLDSSAFARWSMAASAPLLGLAAGSANIDRNQQPALQAANFLVHSIAGMVIALIVLGFIVLVSGGVIRGTWRRHHRFVPSSIHYATAWWLPFSGLLLLLCILLVALQPLPENRALAVAVFFSTAAWSWGAWLWASASVSEHVRAVPARVGVVLVAAISAILFTGSLLPRGTRGVTAQVTAQISSGFSSLASLKELVTPTPSPPVRTYAIVVDMLGAADNLAFLGAIRQLGVESKSVLRDHGCTLKRIADEFQKVRTLLKPEDRLIVLIAGHGSEYGDGVIQMADGKLTSQDVRRLVRDLPTHKCLLLLDSCFGGKFIDPLIRDDFNGIVITSTDDQNVGYRGVLHQFWPYLGSPQADSDCDGWTTVQDAFWTAYEQDLKTGETIRRQILNQGDQRQREIGQRIGRATPQLKLMGDCPSDAFQVKVKAASRPE
jgi:hypothetical protein